MMDKKNVNEWKRVVDILPVLTRLARHMFNSGSIEQ
jgi:hypothetical protein